ncbi:MAG: hypothetical protein CL947_01020 [Epsilonproteobacteria bacterium]|nr:hypothetical protein [Campylobacterota bacterium]
MKVNIICFLLLTVPIHMYTSEQCPLVIDQKKGINWIQDILLGKKLGYVASVEDQVLQVGIHMSLTTVIVSKVSYLEPEQILSLYEHAQGLKEQSCSDMMSLLSGRSEGKFENVLQSRPLSTIAITMKEAEFGQSVVSGESSMND